MSSDRLGEAYGKRATQADRRRRNLHQFDEDATIYAARPWTDQSPAIVADEPEEGRLHPEAGAIGMCFLIQVYTAKEFLEGFSTILPEPPYDWLKCARLVIYSICDA